MEELIAALEALPAQQRYDHERLCADKMINYMHGFSKHDKMKTYPNQSEICIHAGRPKKKTSNCSSKLF